MYSTWYSPVLFRAVAFVYTYTCSALAFVSKLPTLYFSNCTYLHSNSRSHWFTVDPHTTLSLHSWLRCSSFSLGVAWSWVCGYEPSSPLTLPTSWLWAPPTHTSSQSPHASSQVPHLVDSLSGLYQLLDARVGTFSRLSRIQGKLDLMLTQAAAVDDSEQDHAQLTTPLVTVTVGGELSNTI